MTFTPAARKEIIEAQSWYEREVKDLGREFRDELTQTLARIRSNPLQFPLVFKTARRALLGRFPYALFFVVQNNKLTVIACFHSSRNPMHWKRRS